MTRYYWDRQFLLLLKPFLGGRMRSVAIETGQAISALQTSTVPVIISIKMISPQYPSFNVTARVASMVPILVDVDAFALPSSMRRNHMAFRCDLMSQKHTYCTAPWLLYNTEGTLLTYGNR